MAKRLQPQQQLVYDILADYDGWLSLRDLIRRSGLTKEVCGAQVRSLRKPQFGGHKVQSLRQGNGRDGLWFYRLVRRHGGTLASDDDLPPQ